MELGVFGHIADLDDLAADLRAAEADGLHSYWLTQGFGHDALTAIAVAAGGLQRLRVGTAVVPVQPRHPMVLAQQALTTNQVLGGRLVVGLGPSHPQVVEPCWGLSYERPARYVREYLEAFTAALTQHVRFRGEVITARGDLTVPGNPPVPQRDGRGARAADAGGRRCARRRDDHLDGRATHAARAHRPYSARGGRTCGPAAAGGGGHRAALRDRRPRRALSRDLAPTLRWYDDKPSYRAVLEREGLERAVETAIAGTAEQVARTRGCVRRGRCDDLCGAAVRHSRRAGGHPRPPGGAGTSLVSNLPEAAPWPNVVPGRWTRWVFPAYADECGVVR